MKKIIFAIGFCALLMTGCERNEINGPAPAGQRHIEVIGRVAEQPGEDGPVVIDRKVSVTDAGVFSWQEGDRIATLETDANGFATAFTLTDPAQGLFSGSVTQGQTVAIALSPATFAGAGSAIAGNTVDETLSDFSVTIPGEIKEYVPGTTNALMVAHGIQTDPAGSHFFSFRQAAALVKFSIVNVPTSTQYVSFTADKKINGTWRFENVLNTTEVSLEGPGTGSANTVLMLKDAVSERNTTQTFYVPVPAQTYTSFTIDLFDAQLNLLATKKISSIPAAYGTLGRGQLLLCPDITLPREAAADLSGDYLILAKTTVSWHVMSTRFNTKYWEQEDTGVDADAQIDFSASDVNFAMYSNEGYKWTLQRSQDGSDTYTLSHYNATDDEDVFACPGIATNAASSGNGHESTSAVALSVTYDSATGAASIGNGTLELRYNSGSPRFTFYTNGGQQQIYLIPYVMSAMPCRITEINCAANQVTITANPANAIIRYTLDGTDPTANSTLYEGPFPITQTVTVKARAFAPDAEYSDSEVASQECVYVVPGSEVIYEQYSGILSPGSYILVYGGQAVKNAVSSNRLVSAAVTVESNHTIVNPDASILWDIAPSGEYWTLYNAEVQAYAGATGSKNQAALLSDVTSPRILWSVESTASSTSYDFVNKARGEGSDPGNKYLRYNAGYGFACYAVGTGGALTLYKLHDSRLDPGMSWSSGSAVAAITGSGIEFTAPTLAPGHATAIHYASSHPAVASVDASGAVTVKTAGETQISAIFDGDATYRNATATYTLTVQDRREKVATPGFNPPAGEVAEGTSVAFTCATAGVTFHYTVDGSTPTASSATGASVTINAATTVKVIAVKAGYIDSDVASAAYTIAGAAESLPYEESFSAGMGKFTIDNVNLGQLSAVWSYDSSNKYMKATSFVSSANHDAESWLVSPLLQFPTLGEGEFVQLKFTQCINKYFGTVADEATLQVKEDGGSWTKVNITYPVPSGTWSAFEPQVVDLSAWAGKKVRIAFKYVGTATTAGTWEIKEFSVKKTDSSAPPVTDTGEEISTGTFTGNTTSISMTTTSGVTITQLKGSGNNIGTSYSTPASLRVYRANQIQFSGKTFTKIEMYYTGSYSGAEWSVVAGGGSVSIDSSNKKVVWTNDAGASTVTLQNGTASGTNVQLRTTKFVVFYQ